ncbi:MAG: autotransporter outer membrane beta-barrel domain-containing protein [Endomicrobium sp.]|jgi:hypothetical protein|nr:autotransporter outer membrane beta-barrel domain-containing protein [Endomicrobium sp.]
MRFKNLFLVLTFLFLFVQGTFAQSAGHFIANVINAAGSANDRTVIYDKLAIISYEDHKRANNMWVQTKYENFNLEDDENSKGSFDDNIGGLSFGYGKEIFKNAALGFFGKYNSHSISQEKSGASVNSYGLGAYGSYLYDDFDFKGILSFSGLQYSTSRDAGANNKAKTDFNGYAVNADIEAAMWLEMLSEINLRPYMGVNIAYMGYGSSNEIGAGSAGLKTDGGNFSKSAMRIGAGLNGKYEKFGWYGGLEMEYILSGKFTEIESSIGGANVKVKSKGAESGSVLIGINAGGDYDISSQMKAYINLNYKVSGALSDFGASAGIAFVFDSF